MKVVIVDDDAWQAEHLAAQLVQANIATTHAAHAAQAIDVISEAMPDCLVLDIALPGVNGMVLLHEIRSHADLMSLPVVVCTNTEVALSELQPYGVIVLLDKSSMRHGDVVAAVKKATQ